nr:helix-turn-helix domain protein [Streptomyces tsukubensis NRRL18488]
MKALRVESGESLRRLAERMGWDWSLFGKMENGETIGGPEVALALDQHYGMKGGLLALWELALGDSTQFKEQYRRYMKLEAETASLSHFSVSTIHGLLQTDGYATAVLSAGGASGVELSQQVEARASRRALLMGDGVPHFRTILSEAVLRTPLADPQEWRAQLEHLLAMADHPRITLQVLLQTAGVHGLDSTDVMFLRLPGGQSVAYTENAHRGELIEESTSVDRLQVAYDAVRDLALSPAQSRTFILRMLEEVPCDDAPPST